MTQGRPLQRQRPKTGRNAPIGPAAASGIAFPPPPIASSPELDCSQATMESEHQQFDFGLHDDDLFAMGVPSWPLPENDLEADAAAPDALAGLSRRTPGRVDATHTSGIDALMDLWPSDDAMGLGGGFEDFPCYGLSSSHDGCDVSGRVYEEHGCDLAVSGASDGGGRRLSSQQDRGGDGPSGSRPPNPIYDSTETLRNFMAMLQGEYFVPN